MATVALAQPVIGPEVATPPLTNFNGASIAPLRDGYVLVWSEEGRIRAGHLDATLHLTGNMLDLPLYQAGDSAKRPSVATTGTSVLVAWEETGPGFDGTIVAALSPDAGQLTRGPQLLAKSRGNIPYVYAEKGTYSVVQGVVVYTLNEALDVSDISSYPNATSVGATPIGVVTSSVRYEQVPPCTFSSGLGGRGIWEHCATRATISIATPSRLFTLYDDYASSLSPAPLTEIPTITLNGDGLIVTWRSQIPGLALLGADGTVAPWTFGDIDMPVVAGNGSQVFAVWHGSAVWSTATLFGAIYPDDGKPTVWLPIAKGHSPIVVPSGANRFVVLYQVDAPPNQTILAGRLIDLQETRKRAAR